MRFARVTAGIRPPVRLVPERVQESPPRDHEGYLLPSCNCAPVVPAGHPQPDSASQVVELDQECRAARIQEVHPPCPMWPMEWSAGPSNPMTASRGRWPVSDRLRG